jgi:formylglycine-generating enzyme required for sulfatase activity
MNISWEDAVSYADWLTRKTGHTYRLLSESEWEYAARAGTTTAYPYEGALSPSMANYDGSVDGSGPSNVNRQRTVAVGSFPANGFGLHDMTGNVSEWVEDCWHDAYTATIPTDGSAWLDGNCNGRGFAGDRGKTPRWNSVRLPAPEAPRRTVSIPMAFALREAYERSSAPHTSCVIRTLGQGGNHVAAQNDLSVSNNASAAHGLCLSHSS